MTLHVLGVAGLATVLSWPVFAQASAPSSSQQAQDLQIGAEASEEPTEFQGTLEPGGVAWNLVRRKIPNEPVYGGPDETYHYQYYLRLNDQPEMLPLARGNRAINGEEYGYINNGLDEKSLMVEWVREGDLVHVFWKTYPCGEGGHYVATELLILKEAKGWKELYRNSHFYSCSMGAENYSLTTETYAWDGQASELVIRREEFEEDGSHKALPLGVKHPEGKWYHRKATITTEWRYRLDGNQLKYVKGEQRIDPGEGTFTLAEIARYVDEKADPAPLVAQIRKLNPALINRDEVKGIVLLDKDLPALAPDTKHYYLGGE